jgi:hypothetical protein
MNRNQVLDNISYLCHLISFLFCLHMVLSQFAKYNYCIYVVWFHRAYYRLVIVVLKDLKTEPASKTAPIGLSKTLKTGKNHRVLLQTVVLKDLLSLGDSGTQGKVKLKQSRFSGLSIGFFFKIQILNEKW